MDLRETYDRIAEDWHKDHQGDDWWAQGTDSFAACLQPGACILDVGCGGGVKSQYFIDRCFSVVGIDFSEKMIDIAKREVPKGEFCVLDMRKVDELDQVFDGIFMQAALLHIPRSEAGEVVKTISDTLKSGGYLYIAVKDKKPEKPNEEMKLENDYGYPYERFFSYFSIDEIRSYFEQAGFEIVFENATPAGNTRWLEVIGQKK